MKAPAARGPKRGGKAGAAKLMRKASLSRKQKNRLGASPVAASRKAALTRRQQQQQKNVPAPMINVAKRKAAIAAKAKNKNNLDI